MNIFVSINIVMSFLIIYIILAPEVLLGNDYSFNFDWWGFGVIMYELLHGIVSVFIFISFNILL